MSGARVSDVRDYLVARYADYDGEPLVADRAVAIIQQHYWLIEDGHQLGHSAYFISERIAGEASLEYASDEADEDYSDDDDDYEGYGYDESV